MRAVDGRPDYAAAPTPGEREPGSSWPDAPDRADTSPAHDPAQADPAQADPAPADPAPVGPEPSPPAQRTTRALVIAAVALIVLGTGAATLAVLSRPGDPEPQAAPSPSAGASSPSPSTPSSSTTPSSTAQPTAEPDATAPSTLSVVGDGSWVADGALAGGTFRAFDAGERPQGCAWDLYDGSGALLTFGEGGGGVPTVTLAADDTLVTAGCGQWRRVDPAGLFDEDDAATRLRAGIWLVGEDVAPGTYEPVSADPAGSACEVRATRGWDPAADPIEVTSVNGAVVALDLERGMQVELSGPCGTWERVGGDS